MGEIDDTARRLLRELGVQAEGKPAEAAEVVPREAAQNLDLDPEGAEYVAALDHLLALGDIERVLDSERRATEVLYRLTKKGLSRAREIGLGFTW